jgi:hypothetical protein
MRRHRKGLIIWIKPLLSTEPAGPRKGCGFRKEILMSPATRRIKRWGHSWLHSDLIGIPFTLAVFAIIVVSVGLYLVTGRVAGLFVGKLLFVGALGGLLALVLLLDGRQGETTEGVSRPPADAPRRVLVVANQGLVKAELCAAICDSEDGLGSEAMIVAPVVASSRLHALADDFDQEMSAAQARLDAALMTLMRAGLDAHGRVDVGAPMTCLVDGLREFPATEVVMMRGGEPRWPDAERFAERVMAEVGLPVTEVETRPAAILAA